jgi:hypothetical protein
MLQASPRDWAITLGLVLLAAGWCGWARWDVARKGEALRAMAEREARELAGGEPAPALETALHVDNDKGYFILGRDWGTARIYLREAGDETMKSLTGFEYYFVFDAGSWQQTDMAAIRDPAHLIEGLDAFARAGHTVERGAYERLQDRIR